MISQLEFLATETVMSFRRHPAMAFAAITCVAAALFVAGLVGLGILNAQYMVNKAMDRVRFNVYFQKETTRDEAMEACNRIGQLRGVASVSFIAKEDAWQKMTRDQKDLPSLIGPNPLPDAVEVKAVSLNAIPGLITELQNGQNWPEVQRVVHAKDISDILISISAGVGRIGSIMGLILLILSLVIIHHTIELTLYARRREIFIMALVGATPTTVALPFLMEGILYGLIGSGVAVGCVYELYQYFLVSVQKNFPDQMLDTPSVYLHGMIVLLIAGVVLGLFGSLVSVIKYQHRPRSKMTNA